MQPTPRETYSSFWGLFKCPGRTFPGARRKTMHFSSRLSLPLVAALLLSVPAMRVSGATSATPSAARPAQKLTPYIFPDGSGSMGLPPGWTVVQAQLGDVIAQGPEGEKLRFGLVVQVIDPTSPQAGVLMAGGNAPGNFIAVPYSADAAT